MSGDNSSLKEKIQIFISRSPLRTPIIVLQMGAYRLSGGKMGGKYRGLPVLLLTTTGRKSGKKRTWPVAYITDGDNYIVTASNAGKEKVSAWYLNLKSMPEAKIEVGPEKKDVRATEATPEERQHLWPILVSKEPHYAEYEAQTKRDIPMMILQPTISQKSDGEMG